MRVLINAVIGHVEFDPNLYFLDFAEVHFRAICAFQRSVFVTYEQHLQMA
jgi:hypothetical protein